MGKMNVLNKHIGDKEAIEIRDWWFKLNGIETDPDKKGIISDEESRKNLLEYRRNEKKLDVSFFLMESLVYGERYENFRSKKIFFDFYNNKIGLN